MKRIFVIAAMVACVSIPALAQRAAAPIGPADPFGGKPDAIQDGYGIYNQNCASCHGANGAGTDAAPPLAATDRLYNRPGDAQVFDAVKHGIPATTMKAFAGLSDDEIWKVTAYVQAIRGTAIDAPLPGDVARGEQVFWDKGGCGGCHMINGKGSLVGPDLSNIAGIRKTAAIINALTKPEHRVYGQGGAAPHTMLPLSTYPVVRVTLADGTAIEGVLKNEDSYSLQVMGLDQQLHLLDRSKVQITNENRSLMPTDYDKRLTPDEFKDLLAFLTRQGMKAPARARASGVPPGD